MTNPISRCPHVATIGSIDKDYFNEIECSKCEICESVGPYLWLCLREGCLFVGCGSGKDKNNHSAEHEKAKAHPLQFNLTSQRIWCYVCNEEVYPNNDPPFELSFLHSNESSLKLINNSVQVNVLNIIEQKRSAIHSKKVFEKSFEPTLFELEHSDQTDITRGTSGLYNLGNTCYMNSALQALSNCVPLTSYLLDCIPFVLNKSSSRLNGHNKSHGKLTKVYSKLIQLLWKKSSNQAKTDIINPSSIAVEIRSINPSFRSYTQQDAQEFLRCFMDQLHSEMQINHLSYSDPKDRSSSSSSDNSSIPFVVSNVMIESEYETCQSDVTTSDDEEMISRSDSGVSLNTNKERRICSNEMIKKGNDSSSIISQIFDGKIGSEIECLTCNRRSKTIETFQDLSLPIPSKEQIHKFHSINEDLHLQSSEQNSNQSWSYWFYSMIKSLWSLNIWGPSLTLQDCLQAFFQPDELTGDNMYSCDKCGKLRNGIKNCRVIHLPEVLCIHLKRFRHDSLIYTKIGSYVSFPLVDLDMKSFIHKDCVNEVHLYDLYSCIVHYGRAGSGHYITYSLNGLNGQWYEYDDENVRLVDSTTVQNAEAYVLFYKKKEANISESYETIRHLLSRDEESLLPFYISRSWINRYFYFAEPGPITNKDFLCKHGGVYPDYWSVINDLVCPVPESVWLYLSEKYGGSGVCNILYPCEKCQLEQENVIRRQREEKNHYLQLKRSEKENDAIYALNPHWFRDWENFVCEKCSEIPGPISNNGICTTKNGVSRLLRRDCNYFQVSESIWKYLYSIYGGGPELLIRSNVNSICIIDEQISKT